MSGETSLEESLAFLQHLDCKHHERGGLKVELESVSPWSLSPLSGIVRINFETKAVLSPIHTFTSGSGEYHLITVNTGLYRCATASLTRFLQSEVSSMWESGVLCLPL